MPDLRLSWNRDEDGVIAVYATDENGRKVAVADFWIGPMRQHMGIGEPQAKAIQQQLAETLVQNWNGPGGSSLMGRVWPAEMNRGPASHDERVRAGYAPDESAGQRCKAGELDGSRAISELASPHQP